MTEPSGLQRAVAIMHRLRSTGGCPWDAEQTHRSLAPYLLEETYETLEAIDLEDPVLLREELGDLLLQVLFHARIAEETEGFGIEDVAGDLADKLVRRHPHVFADSSADTAADVEVSWEAIKKAEKQRDSVTDGIPAALPALALAGKLLRRSAGLDVPLPAEGTGGRLFALVRESLAAGEDPEDELRRAALAYREAIRAAEVAPTATGGTDTVRA